MDPRLTTVRVVRHLRYPLMSPWPHDISFAKSVTPDYLGPSAAPHLVQPNKTLWIENLTLSEMCSYASPRVHPNSQGGYDFTTKGAFEVKLTLVA